MRPKEEAELYMSAAESVVEDDEDFKRDNPDMTAKEYALERVDSDIRYAKRTKQYNWAKHLERVRKWIERR